MNAELRIKFYVRYAVMSKTIEHYEKFLDLWEDADPGRVEVEGNMMT
jgi:hypothetical protein